MPGRHRRIGFSAFCVLELDGSILTLQMRPRWLWGLLGGGNGPFVVRSDEALAFPACKRWRVYFGEPSFGHFHRWVGVQPEGRAAWYFYPPSSVVDTILDALEDAGFRVSREVRPIEEA